MRYIKSFGDFLFEYNYHPHYKDRWNLRAHNFKIISTGGAKNIDCIDLMNRIQIFLNNKNKQLQKYPGSAARVARVVDFGDIKIKKGGEIYLPSFSVLKEDSKNETYEGSIFVAITISNLAITLKLYKRGTSIKEMEMDLEKHFEVKGTFDTFSKIEHVYLNKQINIIDMDLNIDDYERQFQDYTPLTKSSFNIEREATIRKGTQLKDKIVKNVQKNIDGTVFIFFEDGSMKKIIKGGKFTLDDGFTGEVISFGISSRIIDKNNVIIKVKGSKISKQIL